MNDVEALLPAFSLEDNLAQDQSFPTEQPTLLCFIKEDCETCKTTMPLLEALHRANINILLIGQTKNGNEKLIRDFDMSAPILDDSQLKVSFAYDIEIVPTLIWADSNGRQVEIQEGFVKKDWQALLESFGAKPDVAWKQLPDWRPGCGSLSVDPVINDRLRAEAENRPSRSWQSRRSLRC